MKFLIIIPCHNEAHNIAYCLESLHRQTLKSFKVVVVNDGSTDKSADIIDQFAADKPQFTFLHLPPSEHEPGAKVVRTFNKGLEISAIEDVDVICKFDADIIFPNNYLAELDKLYSENLKIGMASGIVKIKRSVFDKTKIFDFKNTDRQWMFENLSSPDHVRGPIKSYRKACFQQMDGLRPVLGWDNIDVLLTKKNGWETATIKNLWVKHLRPTAYKYKSQKAEKLGEYFYNIGLNFPLAFISSVKSAFKNRSITEVFITMQSFLKQKSPRVLTSEEIKFIRKFRWQQMFRKLV